ncbi:MAG: RNA polymerase sigma factor [Deltaproteobacteria bacterium]|nr:RNA polymerase sigma factor [Deltaproteobacteria bacterium]
MKETEPKLESERQLVDRAVAGDPIALDAVASGLSHDLYNLAVRMVGGRTDAEDATQEILIQIITHLAQWRGDSSLRTWAWRIAVRHLMRMKRSKDEEVSSFEAIEQLIEAGSVPAALPEMSEAELTVLETELRIACTQGMLSSLDRDMRVSWILAEVFELEGPEAAEVLDVDAATHRKRLSRARTKLGEWMGQHCGIANPENACRCRRQIPIALEVGAIDSARLQFATHPQTSPSRLRHTTLPLIDAADEVEMAAMTICCHPDYAAPDKLVARIRDLIESGSVRMLS